LYFEDVGEPRDCDKGTEVAMEKSTCRMPSENRDLRVSRRDFVRLVTSGAAGMLFSRFALSAERLAGTERPNIIFILIDDLGWTDLGCYGSTLYETPNIDRLAAEGMRFTDAYAACPVCSPTRASIMTGKYPARLPLTNFIAGKRTREGSPILPADYLLYVPTEEVTVAEVLKSAGYATCHVGKWHLGGEKQYWPENQGFDVNIGGTGSGMPRSYFWPGWDGNPPVRGNFDGEYLTDRLTEEACKFIEGCRQKPFFLYLSHYAVHIPIEAKERKIEKYQQKIASAPPAKGKHDNPYYAAMIESIDDGVGRVLETLRRLKIDDRTVVMFFSDNGGLSVPEGKRTPATTNAPLRAGKGYLYEGGIREPLIVGWPGVVKAGSECSTPVVSTDFFPTICEMAGLGLQRVQTRGPIDGVSIVPLLKNAQANLDREAIYWHYPHFSNQGGRPGAAIRVGDFKLIEEYEFGQLELYNLKEDIGETTNLADKMPEKTQQLHRMLRRWRKDVNANMPLPNPGYSPEGNK
jgi:arylsulfatase A-like enzyme